MNKINMVISGYLSALNRIWHSETTAAFMLGSAGTFGVICAVYSPVPVDYFTFSYGIIMLLYLFDYLKHTSIEIIRSLTN